MAPLTVWSQWLIANTCGTLAIVWIVLGFAWFVNHAVNRGAANAEDV